VRRRQARDHCITKHCAASPIIIYNNTIMSRLILISAAVLLAASTPAVALVSPVADAAAAAASALKGGPAISSMTKSLETVFTTEDIDKILPHRYPFALVDKVVEYTPGKSAVGIKCVTKVRFPCLSHHLVLLVQHSFPRHSAWRWNTR
jgi:hypothetical protein